MERYIHYIMTCIIYPLNKVNKLKIFFLFILLVNFTCYTTAYAQDFDHDGVPDLTDLDDDNDGIEDVDEVMCSSTVVWSEDFESYNIGDAPDAYDADSYFAAGSGTLTTGTQNGFVSDNISTINLDGKRKRGSRFLVFKTDNGVAPKSGIEYEVYGSKNAITVQANSHYVLRFAIANTSLSNIAHFSVYINGTKLLNNISATGFGNSSWTIFYVPWDSNSETSLDFSIRSKDNFKIPGRDFLLDELFVLEACDTDADGIPNQMDLDSDDDACSDANEYYGLTTADGGDDGFYGLGTQTVTAKGLVSMAWYNGSTTNVYSPSKAVTFTTDAVDKTISKNGDVAFSVTTSAGNNCAYQWQQSPNSGNTWVTLNNGGTKPSFAGTTTNTLTILDVPDTYDGYQYRLIATPSDNICLGNTISSISKVAHLSVVTLDSDNDGITDDVDLDDDNDGIKDCIENGGFASVADAFTLRGVASLTSPNEALLTDDVFNQQGQIWFNRKIDFSQSFTINFSANLGTNDTGADGVAIVFQNSPAGNNAVGIEGEGLGARTIVNGIALELDTYNNGIAAGDIMADHGCIDDTDGNTYLTPLTTPVDLGNLEDGNWHAVSVNWDASTQTIFYTVDGINAGTLVDDLVNNRFGGSSDVYFGFTASTGAAKNSQSVRFTTMDLCADTSPIDTDNDGITNELDLDSDGDGCPDAVEGSDNISYEMLDADGRINVARDGISSPVEIDAYGVPRIVNTGSTYNTDNQKQGQGKGESLTINGVAGGTANSDQSVCINANAAPITLSSYNGDIQWQTSDDGKTFTNISGATSNNYSAGKITQTRYLRALVTSPGGCTAYSNTVTIKVITCPLVLTPDSQTAPEDNTITGNVLTNDNTPTGNTLSVVKFIVDGKEYTSGQTTNITNIGSFQLNSNGSYSFTPEANYNGTLPTIKYIATEGLSNDTTTLNITITPVNDLPQANNITLTTNENTAISATATATDIENDPLTFSKSTNPAHGTAVVNTDGSFTYTPSNGYNGNDSFSINISDGKGVTSIIVNITVNAKNDAPVANPMSITTTEDTPINATANATDPDGDKLTFSKSTSPTHGTAVVNSSGAFTYTPNTNYNGNDSFIIIVNDGNGGSTSITISITVTPINDAPVGPDQNISTNEDTPINGSVTATDADNDLLTYLIASNPSHGTVVVKADGTFTYTPNLNFNGSDYFTIKVSDGKGGYDDITVNVTVSPVNDAPVGNSLTLYTPKNTAINGTATATDADGDILNFSKFSSPSNGTVALNSSGAFTYTPSTNYTGTDSFVIRVIDGKGGTVNITVTIQVNSTNDPPIGVNKNVSTNEDTPVNSSVSATDANNDALTFSKKTDPLHGTTLVNANGTFTYTPSNNYNGTDSFIINVIDGKGGSDDVVVSITVTPINDLPNGADLNLSTPEDTPIIGIATATDADGDAVTFSKSTSPTHGLVVVSSNGKFTYVPSANYSGNDSFIIKASDGKGGTADITVYITITPVNDVPIGSNKSISTNEDTPINSSVVATDKDNDPLTFSTLSDPSHGSVVVNANGTFTYTPSNNYFGSDSFTINVSDGQGGNDDIIVSITVLAVNDVPMTNPITLSTPRNTPVNGTATATDADNDVLTFSKSTNPVHGTVVVNTNGTFTYTPSNGYSGTDTFIISVSDGKGGNANITVTINVNFNNDAPLANAINLTTNEDSPISDNAKATDANGDLLTFSKSTNPGHGTVVVNANGSFTYTPSANYFGTDNFAITVDDGNGGTVSIPVKITINPVNDSPTATGNSHITNEDTPVSGNIIGTDVEGDPLTYSKASNPSHGSVSMNTDGSYTYSPTSNYSGADSFTIEVTDGKGGNVVVTVNITIKPVNDVPLGNNVTITTPEDTKYNGQVNATDADTDPLIYSKGIDPSHGTITVGPDGKYTYTPDPNYNGADSFTVTANDNNGGSTDILVNITVTPVPDAPTAPPVNLTTLEDNPVDGAIKGNDVDGDILTYTKNTNPSHGTVSVNTNGTFTYTPDLNYNGTDQFNVLVDDGTGNSVVAKVTITIGSDNDNPEVTPLFISTDEDTPISGTATATDVDGDILTFLKGSDPGFGTVTIATNGDYTYTPNQNFNGTDKFSMKVDDGHGGIVTLPVTVTVKPINDIPEGNDMALTTKEDVAVSDIVVAIDADGDALNFSKATNPQHGTASVLSDGKFTYTPSSNYNGTDRFTVSVTDGNGGATTISIDLTVSPVNDIPVSTDINLGTPENTPVHGTATATDVDLDVLTFTKSNNPSHGTATVNNNGTFTYTPDTNFNGADDFTIEVNDGNGGSTTISVKINVSSTNNNPVASPITLTTNEDVPISYTATATDPDGDVLSFNKKTGPSHGTATVNSDGSLSFTPDLHFNGSDQFIITVSDGNGGTVDVTVNIVVNPINDNPTGNDVTISTSENIAISSKVTANDIDGDVLTFTKVSDPSHGSVTVNSDGTFTYTPSTNYNGTDECSIEVNDGNGGQITLMVRINVNSVNNSPIGSDISLTTMEDVAVDGTATAVDADGDILTYNKVSDPLHGTVTVNGDGTFTYTPDTNYNGNDNFSINTNDGNGGIATIIVTITVNPINDAPIGNPITLTTSENTEIGDTAIATDIDGDKLSYSKDTNPNHGTTTVNADGTFSYIPDLNYHGTDKFTIHVSDGNGGSCTIEVNIVVNSVNNNPVAPDMALSVNEDTTLSDTATATDADGDALTFSKKSEPSHGTATVAANGIFTYTPSTNYNGNDAFTITVNDGNGGSSDLTVTLTVEPLNDEPNGNDLNISTTENISISDQVIATDIDGDVLNYSKNTNPSHGTVTVLSDGTFEYIPSTNYFGKDQFTVEVNDGNGGSINLLVNITINHVNITPTTNDIALTTNEDTAVNGVASAIDSDGDPLTFTKASNPSHGTVAVNADGRFTYTPTSNYHGTDNFNLTVSDGLGGIATIQVTITINSVNDSPYGNSLSVITEEDTALQATVIATDIDGDDLTYTINTNPSHGNAIVYTDGTFSYIPSVNYNGTDDFTVTADDGNGGTVVLAINIIITPVNDPPSGNAISLVTSEDTAVNGKATATDPEGNTLTFSLTTVPSHGIVVVNPNGDFIYSPAINYNGIDNFVVTANDGQGGTTTIHVDITITPANDAPDAANIAITTNEDSPVSSYVSTVDIDGDLVSYSKLSNPSYGTVTVLTDGNYTYVPQINYNGKDKFTILASDGSGSSAVVTVEVTILPINDNPTANDISLITNEETPISFTAGASDIDGDAITFSTLITPSHGIMSISSSGKFTYIPAKNYSGSDSFTLLADDLHGGKVNILVSIIVNPVNDPPVGIPDAKTGIANEAITGTVVATDPDNDNLTFSKNTDPTHGTVNLNSDGTYTYTPDDGYFGNDSFTVLVNDNKGGKTIIPIQITVKEVNINPKANNTHVITDEEVQVSSKVTATDANGDALLFTAATKPLHGSVTVSSNGSFTYKPSENYNGEDSFTVNVSDGKGGIGTAIVTIFVDEVNDTPVSKNATKTIPKNTSISDKITATDVDGDVLLYDISTKPEHGFVEVDGDGNYNYTPTTDYTGNDSFEVLISDGNGGFTISKISLRIISFGYADLSVVPLFNEVLAVSNPSDFSFIYESTYKWYKDGELLDSDKQYCGFGKSIPSGDYIVEIYLPDGTVINLAYTHEEITGNGTHLESIIFPNPLKEVHPWVNVKTDWVKESGVELRVYNELGIEIQGLTIEKLDDRFTIKGFKYSGVYLLSLVQDGNVIETHKLIVEK